MIFLANKNNQGSQKIAGSMSVILTCIICGVIFLAVIVWAMVTKSANAMSNKVAMTVGDEVVSGVELEYQYKDSILQFQNNYSDIIDILGVDFSADLSTQEYAEGQSWKDYFVDSAVSKLEQQYLLIAEAKANGVELSEDEKNAVISELDLLKKALESYGYSFSSYIQSVYGEDISYSDFKEFNLSSTLAYNYSLDVIDGFEIADNRIDKYFEENKEDFETVDFHSYIFDYTVPTDVAEGDTSYKDAAKAAADAALAAVTNADSFLDAMLANETDETSTVTSTLSSSVKRNAVPEDLVEWLYDDARVAGDKTVIEIEDYSGYAVLYYVGGEENDSDYATVNVKYMLYALSDVADVLDAEGKKDETATKKAQEEADAAVYAKAEAALKEWRSGAATAESFEELIEKHSADLAGGGSAEQVTLSASEALNDWFFDEARKTGDCEIVETEDGYYIIYFEGHDELAWRVAAENALKSEDYDAYLEDLAEKYEVVVYEEVIDLLD